jgi:hypothetical protein
MLNKKNGSAALMSIAVFNMLPVLLQTCGVD